jgi:Ca2+-binding RTX toxin-like protein
MVEKAELTLRGKLAMHAASSGRSRAWILGAAVLAATLIVLLGGPGSVTGAALPPGQPGVIAFQRGDDASADIWTIRANGTGLRNLTAGSATADIEPSFSPNGARIAYSHDDGTSQEIYVMNADGSNPHPLLPPDPGVDEEPAFGPNGQIAFSSNRDGDFDVWIVNANGTGPTNLTNSNAGEDAEPSFSPDGRRIAFGSDRAGGDTDVWLMDPDGTDPVDLTTGAVGEDSEPAFSPLGNRIAFTREGGADIWVMTASGGDRHALTGPIPREEEPSFAPTGARVIYSGGELETEEDVLAIDPDDGGNPDDITNLAGTEKQSDWQTLHFCSGRRALIVGTLLADVRRGGRRADAISLLGGRDVGRGRAGRDRICGDKGKDRLVGGRGGDRLKGGPGRDRLIGGPGFDVCVGGAGRDLARGCEVRKRI